MTLKLHPRRHTPCHRHPDQPLTSLCAPCLRERLSHINPPPSSGATCSTSSSSSSSSSAAVPELRRCKTFSAEKGESAGLSYEPRRRSCEVRGTTCLEDLLTVDDERAGGGPIAKCMVESKNLGLLGGTYPVHEVREEEDESDSEVRVSTDVDVPNAASLRACDLDLEEAVGGEDSRTMKEFIDLELQRNSKPVKRDFKEIAGSFWIAASVFSKKLQKWKGRQRSGRPDGERDTRRHGSGRGGGGLGEMRLEDLRGRRLRDVQQDSGEYGFGRRSCDTDPRFSIDIGRASIDGGRISVDGIGKRFFDTDPRLSLDLGRASVDCGRMPAEEAREGGFEAPRASWDGYMNGRMMPRGATAPMVSVIENAMATVYGYDNRALAAETMNMEKESKKTYGAIVARHLDSVSLHMGRKSVDHCSAKMNANLSSVEGVVSKNTEVFHGAKLLITEKELMDSRRSSLKDDSSDSFDTASKDMTSSASSSSTGIASRKSRKWVKFLNVLSLLSRQKQCKSGHDENVDCSKKVDQEEEVSSDPNNWKLTRSRSVAASAFGMKGKTDAKSSLSLKKCESGVLQRNCSARYSSSSAHNGMLRFYLTPLITARRNKFGKNNKLNKCSSSARSVLKV